MKNAYFALNASADANGKISFKVTKAGTYVVLDSKIN